MKDLQTRCWAEISFDAIENNYRELRRRLPAGCRFLGVVKADAYGQGAVPVARLLEQLGAEYLAVACIEEAAELRKAGIKAPVLILGYTDPKYTESLIEYDLTQTVPSLEAARLYASAAGTRRLKVHLKADTGMGRIGFMALAEPEKARREMLEAMALPALDIEGIFTHFAVSDVPDKEYTEMQFDCFAALYRDLEDMSGKKFTIKHCANSGAVINYPEMSLDMVRPGIALYGAYHGETGISLKQSMSLKTRICQIREMQAGLSVSYGKTWTSQKKCRVAVLSIGYADGLMRCFSNRMSVLINGELAPIIGTICMDMAMADVTDVKCSVGDEVLIFGEKLSLARQAELAGTISYELMTMVSKRVPRLYI